MEGYDVAQICLNGHVVNDMALGYKQFNKEFCDKCGEKTTTVCAKCSKPIKGHYHISGFIGSHNYSPPRFCDGCGSPFPWIETKLEATKELVDLMDNLTQEENQDLKNAIDDLVRETSRVPVARIKFKKYLSRINSDISKGLTELMNEILSDKVKSQI